MKRNASDGLFMRPSELGGNYEQEDAKNLCGLYVFFSILVFL